MMRIPAECMHACMYAYIYKLSTNFIQYINCIYREVLLVCNNTNNKYSLSRAVQFDSYEIDPALMNNIWSAIFSFTYACMHTCMHCGGYIVCWALMWFQHPRLYYFLVEILWCKWWCVRKTSICMVRCQSIWTICQI